MSCVPPNVPCGDSLGCYTSPPCTGLLLLLSLGTVASAQLHSARSGSRSSPCGVQAVSGGVGVTQHCRQGG